MALGQPIRGLLPVSPGYPGPDSLSGAFPLFSSLEPHLLLESGGDCLPLLRRQQGNMTSHSGPNPKRHWCWLGIKAAVPFLTFIGPHLTLTMCSRHFIVCQGDKQNPPPESGEGCLRGRADPAEADKCFSHPGRLLSAEVLPALTGLHSKGNGGLYFHEAHIYRW